MLLEELLFCAVFIVLPLVGMVGAVIKKALKDERSFRALDFNDFNDFNGLSALNKRKAQEKPHFTMSYRGGGAEKQIGEGQDHLPIHLLQHKIRTHPRAGP